MKELLFLFGPSDSGKDYLASTRFSHFKQMKLNQPFKDVFEKDHYLPRGICNDKAQREMVLKEGPMKGWKLGAAMARSYTQSLYPEVAEYGAKFAGYTLVKGLQNFYEDFQVGVDKWVVTDCRKVSEVTGLYLLAEELDIVVKYIKIQSNRGITRESDIHQDLCMAYLDSKFVPCSFLRNDY